MKNYDATNKIIAEFMGMDAFAMGYDRFEAVENKLYHESWDWLMPVVRKIVEYCCNEDDNDVYAFESDYYTSILDTIPLADIESSYKVVVEFIKWYNDEYTGK